MKNTKHTEQTSSEHISYKDIFKQKEYLKIILAGLINRFGDSIDAIAFTWLVYAITGSAAWSALVFAMNQLPSVLLQPFAGALVEGMNKKKLMVFADIIRGITTTGLATLYIGGCLSPYMLLLFTLINSSVEAFRIPASLATVPRILDKKYYTYGTSLNSTLNTIMQLIGLGSAGIIIGAFGIGCAIVIDAASFFGSALILSFLQVEENHLQKDRLHIKEYFLTLKAGVVYLKKQPIIRNFCLLSVLLNALLTPLNSLESPLIYEVLGQGSELLSIFSLAFTAGMGIGAFLYPFLCPHFSVRTQFIAPGILIGTGIYCYTIGENFQDSIIAIYTLTITVSLICGIAVSFMSAALNVCFMKTVKQEYLARVGSIFNAGACAATPALSFIVSTLTAIFSVSQIFKLSALCCVIIFTVMALIHIRLE